MTLPEQKFVPKCGKRARALLFGNFFCGLPQGHSETLACMPSEELLEEQENDTLREIIRLLMHQVREEQALRAAMLKSIAVEHTVPVPVPTDSEVEARIQELSELAKKNLTNKPGSVTL